jgi:hypothetical protein
MRVIIIKGNINIQGDGIFRQAKIFHLNSHANGNKLDHISYHVLNIDIESIQISASTNNSSQWEEVAHI